MSDSLSLKQQALVTEADKWVGTKSGDPMVHQFQGVFNGTEDLPWCMYFVQFCIKQVDDSLGDPKTVLVPSGGVLDVWNRTRMTARVQGLSIVPGDIVLWQHYDHEGKPTVEGHAGIVARVTGPGKFETIEGNTTPGPGIARIGDGVYRKVRDIGGSSTMRLKGFLRAW